METTTMYLFKNDFKKWVNQYFNFDNHELIDYALVNFSELYCAVKNKKNNEVTAYITIIQFYKNKKENFSYKVMHESAHPFLYNCPMKIFKLLSNNIPNCYARDWREGVAKKINLKIELNNIRKYFRPFKTDDDIRFSDGTACQYFKPCSKLKKLKNVYYGYTNSDFDTCLGTFNFNPLNHSFKLIEI